MRIALISMHTSPAAVPGAGDAGGMNVVVASAAHALAARGHEVTVVTRASEEAPAGERPLEQHSTAAQHGTLKPSHTPRLVSLSAGAPDLRKEELPSVVSAFAAGLRALGSFDAVHAHYWLSGVAAHEAFGASQRLPVQTFHTLAAQKNAHLAPGDAPEDATRLAAERRLAATSLVVAGSRSELAGVTEHYGVPERGAAIVHPGVDTDLFKPMARDPALPLRVTVLGRVQPLKGQDLVVRAAGELAAADPALFSRTEWVIAGEPTPGAEEYAESLRTLASTHGVAARLRFLPAQTRAEAAELLALSALVVVPSHSETFGLTALEAAACGVPVLAAGHTGLLEAVPAGVAGGHLTDRDPRAWAQAIRDLLRNDAARARIGRAARAHAKAHDWAAHAAALERVYEQAAAAETSFQR